MQLVEALRRRLRKISTLSLLLTLQETAAANQKLLEASLWRVLNCFPPLLWAVGEGINLVLVKSSRSSRRRCSRIIRASLCMFWVYFTQFVLISPRWFFCTDFVIATASTTATVIRWQGCFKWWLKLLCFPQPSVNTMLAGSAVGLWIKHDVWSSEKTFRCFTVNSKAPSVGCSVRCVLFLMMHVASDRTQHTF